MESQKRCKGGDKKSITESCSSSIANDFIGLQITNSENKNSVRNIIEFKDKTNNRVRFSFP